MTCCILRDFVKGMKCGSDGLLGLDERVVDMTRCCLEYDLAGRGGDRLLRIAAPVVERACCVLEIGSL